MHLQIDWTSLIVQNKFTVFALFYFVFEGNFPSTSPRGAYIWRGDLTESFLRHRFEGLIHGGAYFRNFTGVFCGLKSRLHFTPKLTLLNLNLLKERSYRTMLEIFNNQTSAKKKYT